jgi:hypothetical protein
VYMIGFDSPGVMYYLGRPIESYHDIGKIGDQDDDTLLIVTDQFAASKRNEFDSRFLPIGKVVYERESYTFYVKKNGR